MKKSILTIACACAAFQTTGAQMLLAPSEGEGIMFSATRESFELMDSFLAIQSQNATYYPTSLAAAGIHPEGKVREELSSADQKLHEEGASIEKETATQTISSPSANGAMEGAFREDVQIESFEARAVSGSGQTDKRLESE